MCKRLLSSIHNFIEFTLQCSSSGRSTQYGSTILPRDPRLPGLSPIFFSSVDRCNYKTDSSTTNKCDHCYDLRLQTAMEALKKVPKWVSRDCRWSVLCRCCPKKWLLGGCHCTFGVNDYRQNPLRPGASTQSSAPVSAHYLKRIHLQTPLPLPRRFGHFFRFFSCAVQVHT
jgi:hypothetical protein